MSRKPEVTTTGTYFTSLGVANKSMVSVSHIDSAGSFLGRTFFIVVDAHSKWLEVTPVVSTSSQQAVQVLKHLYSTHGLPEVVVSDNGTAFTSVEFQTFMKRNGIRHVRCAPYHPSSKGLAERAVQASKEAMNKTKGNIDVRIARFLFQYRITPHVTTGQSPAQLILKHQPLDLVPDVGSRVQRIKNARKWIMTEELKFAHLGWEMQFL